jgi:hypothetical protein
MPMTAWEEVGIPSAYINAIEKEGLLPGPKKLEQIATVFARVAGEQGAADPHGDTRSLWHRRDHEVFVKRLGIDPRVADVFVSLRSLMREAAINPDRREALLDTMQYATERLTDLDADRQEEFLNCLRATVAEFDPSVSGMGR